MKVLKTFIKHLKAPRRSGKIKIEINLLSSSGIGTRRDDVISKFERHGWNSNDITVDLTVMCGYIYKITGGCTFFYLFLHEKLFELKS